MRARGKKVVTVPPPFGCNSLLKKVVLRVNDSKKTLKIFEFQRETLSNKNCLTIRNPTTCFF